MKRVKTLIIGTAPAYLIKKYIDKTFSNSERNRIHLLIPERDRQEKGLNGNVYNQPATFFKGIFHPFFPPLLKTIIQFRPDKIVIVCGMTYDHDNVLKSVLFYSKFLNFELILSLRDQELPAKKDLHISFFKESITFLGLGLTALLIKVISPFKKIRVAEIWSERIGHQAIECELFLCQKDMGKHKGYLDLFCYKDNSVANKTLARMYARQMRTSKYFHWALDAIRRFNMSKNHELQLVTRQNTHGSDLDCIMQETKKHLEFSPLDHAKGKDGLKALGLDPDRPFICILGRDPAYLEKNFPNSNDADLQAIRDMDIEDFKPTVNYLLAKGYSVIRMGSIVKNKLNINHPNFVDYATSNTQSDFLDVYLTGNCSIFISVMSGLQYVSSIFRRPVIKFNTVQLEMVEYCPEGDLAMFKILFSKDKKRILKLKEVIDMGLGKCRVEEFQNHNIEIINNTPDEILEATKEMLMKINNTWEDNQQDIELQNSFKALLEPTKYYKYLNTNISAYFLRKHDKDFF